MLIRLEQFTDQTQKGKDIPESWSLIFHELQYKYKYKYIYKYFLSFRASPNEKSDNLRNQLIQFTDKQKQLKFRSISKSNIPSNMTVAQLF